MRAYEYRHVVGFEETNLIGNVYYVNHVRWQGRCREMFLRDHAQVLLRLLQPAGGGKLRYQARRGSLRAEQGKADGIANFFIVECPKDDGRLRFGIWFGPEANPGVPAAEADFTGTPADPQALREFAGHFRLCA